MYRKPGQDRPLALIRFRREERMGQIADDMIDGTTCSLCGRYFHSEEVTEPTTKGGKVYTLFTHGYPVVCWECWKTLSKSEKKDYQRAIKPTI